PSWTRPGSPISTCRPRSVLLTELVRAELLRVDPEVAFTHPIVRAAIYEGIGAGERTAAHRRAAALLRDAGAEPERAAPPRGDGAEPGRPRAAGAAGTGVRTRALLRAAERRRAGRLRARDRAARVGSPGPARAARGRDHARLLVRPRALSVREGP